MAGRRPRLCFRGLLKLHSRYGLQGCSPTLQWTLSRGFDPVRYPTGPLVSYHVYDNYMGGSFPHWQTAPLRSTWKSVVAPLTVWSPSLTQSSLSDDRVFQ